PERVGTTSGFPQGFRYLLEAFLGQGLVNPRGAHDGSWCALARRARQFSIAVALAFANVMLPLDNATSMSALRMRMVSGRDTSSRCRIASRLRARRAARPAVSETDILVCAFM